MASDKICCRCGGFMEDFEGEMKLIGDYKFSTQHICYCCKSHPGNLPPSSGPITPTLMDDISENYALTKADIGG